MEKGIGCFCYEFETEFELARIGNNKFNRNRQMGLFPVDSNCISGCKSF